MSGATAGAPVIEPGRAFLIDALNLAWWCDRPPSLRLPIAVLAGLRASGRAACLYFDASARHQLGHQLAAYQQLATRADRLLEVPSGIPADRLLLRDAGRQGACIISRDRYRDHRRRHRRLIDDPSRIIGGFVADDRIQLPLLALDLPLPASVDAALALLEPG